MPLGIVVMYWNERKGFEIKGKYPEKFTFQEKALMQIYLQHEYTGEHGMVSFENDTTHVVSYYTGEDLRVYIALFLKKEEETDDFESILMQITQTILPKFKSEQQLKIVFPSLFDKLTRYSNFYRENKKETL